MEHLKIKKKNIIHIDHEKGHQYYALFASPEKFRKKSLILTNEGMGDRSNLTVSKVLNNNLKEIFASKENRVGTSIVYYFAFRYDFSQQNKSGTCYMLVIMKLIKHTRFKNLFIAKIWNFLKIPKDLFYI